MIQIQHDSECSSCDLGRKRNYLNTLIKKDSDREVSVGGAGPQDLTKVKLIVLSDFPGAYEAQHGIPQFDARTIKPEYKVNNRERTSLLNALNAGAMMRMALEKMYGLNTYEDCWISNAVKCNPGKQKVIEAKHTKPCASKWLSTELQILNEYCPTAPILIAGSVAFSAIKLLYKDHKELQNLNSCRRRNDIRLDDHPTVFTDNSAKAARSQPRIETEDGVTSNNGKQVIYKNEWLYPFLPGSPAYSFVEDIRFLRDFLLKD